MITKIDIKLTNGTFVTLNYDEAKEVYEDLKKVFANTYVPPQLYPGSGTPTHPFRPYDVTCKAVPMQAVSDGVGRSIQ